VAAENGTGGPGARLAHPGRSGGLAIVLVDAPERDFREQLLGDSLQLGISELAMQRGVGKAGERVEDHCLGRTGTPHLAHSLADQVAQMHPRRCRLLRPEGFHERTRERVQLRCGRALPFWCGHALVPQEERDGPGGSRAAVVIPSNLGARLRWRANKGVGPAVSA